MQGFMPKAFKDTKRCLDISGVPLPPEEGRNRGSHEHSSYVGKMGVVLPEL